MIFNNLKEKIIYVLSIGISIFLLFFFITTVWIGYEAKRVCKDAQREYGGDCIDALILKLDDEKNSYRDRNDAIWALGQFGGERGLPVLQKYYTGTISEREPLDNTLSQYELKKAINLASGGTNITAIFWRSILK